MSGETTPGSMINSRQALNLWWLALRASMASEDPDLTARQMAILLTVYLAEPPQTVRGLAAGLGLSKPVITRALDRLAGHDFIRRKPDDTDRRSIFILRTLKGSVFLSDFAAMVAKASGENP